MTRTATKVIARLLAGALDALDRGEAFTAGHMTARAEAYADLESDEWTGERARQLADAVHTTALGYGGPAHHVSRAYGVLGLLGFLARCRK